MIDLSTSVDIQQLMYLWLNQLDFTQHGWSVPSLSNKDWTATGFVEYTFIQTRVDVTGDTRSSRVRIDCWGAKKNRSGAVSPDKKQAIALSKRLLGALGPQIIWDGSRRYGLVAQLETDALPDQDAPDNYACVTFDLRVTWTVLKEGS